jgi:ADP-ribose pyrophosphatase YjhB (NUDIX family)
MDKKQKVERYAGILVKYNNKVLLCKRSSSHKTLKGVWSIPAGSIEVGEKPRDAAIREFYEETNVLIDNADDLELVGVINRYARDNKYIKGVMYVYVIEVNEELIPDLVNAKDGEEHTECGYFTIIDLPFDDHKDQLFKLILNNF